MSNMMKFVNDFRSGAKISDAKRDFGLVPPDNVERICDLQYTGTDVWNRLDIYKPLNTNGALPVIIDCHGGGWIYGDKELYGFYCMSLAQRGFAVVNFNYHLAPEYDFYTQLREVNDVVKFTLDNAERYGFDVNNIFIAGDSAGGAMAGNYTNICTNEAYAKRFDFTVPDGFVPKGALLNCGVFSSDAVNDELAEALFGSDFEDKLGDVDVISHTTVSFPPCYIATAPDDMLRDCCYRLYDRLKELGTRVEFREYSAQDKLLGHCFHVDMKSRYADICNDEECAFLKSLI